MSHHCVIKYIKDVDQKKLHNVASMRRDISMISLLHEPHLRSNIKKITDAKKYI